MFANGLRRRGLGDYLLCDTTEEPSDALLISQDFGRVGVQIVELVDGPFEAYSARARMYERNLQALVEDRHLLFHFIVHDNLSTEILPDPENKRGRQLLSGLSEALLSASASPPSLNRPCTIYPVKFPNGARFQITATLQPGYSPAGCVNWPVAGLSVQQSTTDIIHSVLTKKVLRTYPEVKHRMILLMYSTSGLGWSSNLRSYTIHFMNTILQMQSTPPFFAEIWNLVPLVDPHEEYLVKLWQYNFASATALPRT